VIKTWGANLDLPAVSKEQAQEAYLDATDVTRAITPPTAKAVEARDDMMQGRYNYVATHVNNPAAQYIVMGGKGAVAPAAVGQGSMLIAGVVVVAGGIAAALYIKQSWGVNSAHELGDRLREKGAKRKEALDTSTTAKLVRRMSETAELHVKENVELVRRPSEKLGLHFAESFKGVVKSGREPGAATAAAARTAAGAGAAASPTAKS
jgi:hypothetical protein